MRGYVKQSPALDYCGTGEGPSLIAYDDYPADWSCAPPQSCERCGRGVEGKTMCEHCAKAEGGV
jgi:hypothetical protein